MRSLRIRTLVTILLLSVAASVGCRVSQTPAGIAARAQKIHDRILSIDTHCDTPHNLMRSDWKAGEAHDVKTRGGGQVDLPRMKQGRLDAEFFAAFVGQGEGTPEKYAKAREAALQQIDAVRRMCRDYPALVGLALTPDDALRLKKEGRLSAFIGMENGYPIGRDLSLVQEYFERGVRLLTLVHSRDNDLCDSATDQRAPEDAGLSEFGAAVVRECNRVGMMIDVSHASDKSFYGVLRATRAPILASHSCARAVTDNPRNLDDDMLRALARNGGVIQICFLSRYVKDSGPNPELDKARREIEAKYGPVQDIKDEAVRARRREELEAAFWRYPGVRATVKDLVDQIDHVRRLVGIDHVGIGTDFDGGGGVVGCDDVSGMGNVTEELVRRGYSEKEIAKIWGGNVMRVFRRVIAVSSELGR